MKPTEQKLREVIEKNFGMKEICDFFDFSHSGIRYLLKKYNLKIKKPNKTWTNEQLIFAYKNSKSVAEVIRKLGLQERPGNYRTIKKYEKLLKIDTSHMLGKAHGTTKIKSKVSKKELFSVNAIATRTIKNYILVNNILKQECAVCTINSWNGKKLSLVLDHINGINSDNRIENLRFLCPNCNSLEPTFCRGHIKLLSQIENSKKLICFCGNKKSKYAKRCRLCYKH